MSRRGWLSLMLLLAGVSSRAAVPWQFVTEEFPPYTFTRNGVADGPMVAVLQAACRRLAQTCHISVLPWRRALQLAETGKVDGIFTVVDLPVRREHFYVSTPVVRAHYALVERLDSRQPWQAGMSLAGRHIGVYGPSATEETLKTLPQAGRAQVEVEVDNLTALRKLAAGRYSTDGLVLINDGVANWLIGQERLAGVRILPPVHAFNYSFGLSRLQRSAAEAAQLDQTLRAMCRSGELPRLVRRYGLPDACEG